jgi:hypothetical protein
LKAAAFVLFAGLGLSRPAYSGENEALSEGSSDSFNKQLGGVSGLGLSRPVVAQEPAPDPVVERVDLKALRDSYMNTSVTFRTSAGDVVHLAVVKTTKCAEGQKCDEMDRYFLVLHSERGETFFIKAKKIANVGFLGGKEEVSFAGDAEKYAVKLHFNIASPEASRLEIAKRGNSVIDVSVAQLEAAVAATARIIRLSRNYQLFYGQELCQASSDTCARGKDMFLLMPDPGDVVYSLDPSSMGSRGVSYPTIEKGFGFRIINEVLEIYRLGG